MRVIINYIGLIIVFFLTTDIYSQEPINNSSRPYEYKVYSVVDKMPEFPDGEEGLLEFYQIHTSYKIAKNEKEGLTVYFSIVINEKGEAKHFKILRSQDEELSELTEEIIKKMPRWKSGKKDGKKVKVHKNLGITFIKE